MQAIVLISILIAMATAPINMLVDFLFDVISAPLVGEYEQKHPDSILKDQNAKRSGTVADTHTDSLPMEGSQLPSRMLRRLTLPGVSCRDIPSSVHELSATAAEFLHNNCLEDACSDSSVESTHQEDIERLILDQYDSLEFQDRKDFEYRWGLDYRCFEWIRSSTRGSSGFGRQARVEHRVTQWRRRLFEYKEETEALASSKSDELAAYSDVQKGVEIMHQFFVDLLGRDSKASKIFLSMAHEDFKDSFVVTSLAKSLAWALIVFINVYFVYFSILRGITSSRSWQRDYVIACMVQLVMEVCLFETMECLWIHWVIPLLVRDEVKTAVGVVRHAVGLAFHRDVRALPVVFDSPRYFFVSRQLAELYPHLVEATVVGSFHSYFPPHELDTSLKLLRGSSSSGKQAAGKRRGRSMISTFSRRFNVSIAVFSLLQTLGTISIRIQQLILHTLNPIIVALIALVYWFFLDHPYAALCPLAGLVVYEGLMHLHRRQNDKDSKVVPAINDVERLASMPSAKVMPFIDSPSEQMFLSQADSNKHHVAVETSYHIIQRAVKSAHDIVNDHDMSEELKLSSLEALLQNAAESLHREEMFCTDDSDSEAGEGIMRDALWYGYCLEDSPLVLPFVDPLGNRHSLADITAHRKNHSCNVQESSVELSALRVVKQLLEYHVMCVEDNIFSRVSDSSEQCALTRDAAEVWKASQENGLREPEAVS